MNVSISRDGDIAVAAVKGRVDSSNATEFDQHLGEEIDGGAKYLAVDCADLAYISSAGLRVLLVAIRKTNAAGGSVSLCCVPGHIQEVLEVSGFSRLLGIHGSVEDAKKSFG
ncbi:MAG: STAS domain-containing protein [Gemmatimonadetes bacterium]|nr:STAS domain-containing protein [Gemmatimonadota bacterium]